MDDCILIVTSKGDAHADLIIDRFNAERLSTSIVRLNTEDFITNCKVVFDGKDTCIELADSSRFLYASSIKAVWYRRPMPIIVNETPEVSAFITKQSVAFLQGLYYSCHDTARWINPLPSLARARVKMQQLLIAKEVGMHIPNTVVTNRPELVLKLYDQCHCICLKSLEEPNFVLDGHVFPMFTRVLSSRDEIVDNHLSISACPHLYQEYIPKKYDIRIVCFGARIFAFEIHSQDVDLSKHDFRKGNVADLVHLPHTLPNHIEESLHFFMRKQGLLFSAFDMVLSQDGRYVFLENNPNGQWLWLEVSTRVELSKYFIEFLSA